MTTGSIQIKNGKYYAVLNIRDENGKKKQKWISSGLEVKNNKRKAEMFLQEKILEYSGVSRDVSDDVNVGNSIIDTVMPVIASPAQLTNPKAGEILFADYINHWLESLRKKRRIELNTIEFYESLCKNHLIPYFTSHKFLLSEMTVDNLQAFLDYEKKEGNNHKRDVGLSPKTVKHLKVMLSLVFKEARQEKLVYDNPCEFLVVPKQIKRNPTFFNESQLKELFVKIKDEDLFPLIYLTTFFGLRRSEVLGLKWDSVDFVNKTLTIKHTVVRFSEVIEKDDTKTESSYRTYPLSQEIENILLEQKKLEIAGRKKFKSEYEENDYIFKWNYGRPYTPDYITRKFKKLLIKHEMPQIRFHDLRHSCASLLISKGFTLKDIQEWLGHSDIKVTANIYAHLDQVRKMSIANSLSI